MSIYIVLFLITPFINGMNAKNLNSTKTNVNHLLQKGSNGLKTIVDSVSALPSNALHKFDIRKKCEYDNFTIDCVIKQSNDTKNNKIIDTLKAKTDAITTDANNTDLFKQLAKYNELSIESTFKIGYDASFSTTLSFDIPKVINVTIDGCKKGLKGFKLNTIDFLKRLDFILRYRNLILGSSINIDGKKSLELVSNLDNLFYLYGNRVDVAPKFELSLDSRKVEGKVCLVLKNKDFAITPILYPQSGQYELVVENKITDDIKFGIFWSRDKNVYINLNYSSFWGNSAFQSVALRFIFSPSSNTIKSYTFIHDEILL